MSRGSGLKSQVEDFIDVFAAHDAFIKLQVSATTSASGKAKAEAKYALGRLATIGSDEVTSALLEAASELVPGSGLLSKMSMATARRIGRYTAAKKTNGTEARIDYSSSQELVDDAVALVADTAKALPVVVVIEDLQQADFSVIAVIAGILTSQQPILVISTGESGCLSGNTSLHDLSQNHGASFDLVTDETAMDKNWPAGASLAALEPEAVATLLLHHRPNATGQAIDEAKQRVRSPLAVELIASEEPDFGQETDDGWSFPEEVSGELRDQLRRMWERLGKPIRRALGCMSTAVPAKLDTTVEDDSVDPYLVQQSAKFLGPSFMGQVDFERSGLLGWLGFAPTGLADFLEHGMDEQAVEGLKTGERNALLPCLAHTALQSIDATPEIQVNHVKLLVALASQGVEFDRNQAVEVASSAYVSAAAAYPYRYRAILKWLERDAKILSAGQIQDETNVVLNNALSKICGNRDFISSIKYLKSSIESLDKMPDSSCEDLLEILFEVNDMANIEGLEQDSADSLKRITELLSMHPDLDSDLNQVKLRLATYDSASALETDSDELIEAIPMALALDSADRHYLSACMQYLAQDVELFSEEGVYGSYGLVDFSTASLDAATLVLESINAQDQRIHPQLLGCIARIFYYTGSDLYDYVKDKWLSIPPRDFYEAASICHFMLSTSNPKEALSASKMMHSKIIDDVMVLDHEKAQICIYYARSAIRCTAEHEIGQLPTIEEQLGKLFSEGDIDAHHQGIVLDGIGAYVNDLIDILGLQPELIDETLGRMNVRRA